MPRIGRVSVVVCNYDGERYLAACLRSVQALGARVDEIVVVDNASRDGGVALIERDFPGVRVLRLARNDGPCAARNAGMRAARNRWVFALDNDAIPNADALDKLVAALEADPQAVAAQTRNVFADAPERVHYDGGEIHYLGLLSLRNFYRPLAEAEGSGVLRAAGLIAIAILLDRDVVLGLGGYDESFFILFEDSDLALRLRIEGHALLSVEDALCLHQGGTPGISFRAGGYPKRRAFYHSRNRWLLLAKNYRVRTLLVALPGLVLYEAVWVAFTLAKGHLGAHVAGKVAFFRLLGSVRAKRRAIQRGRRANDRELLVAGPLTLSPELLSSPARRSLARALDAVLTAWWRLVARFAA
jgi:GT2 family glycosyltransferase